MSTCQRCGVVIDELSMPWCDPCYEVRHLPPPLPVVMKPARWGGYWIDFGLLNLGIWAGGLLGGWISGVLW